MSQSSSILDYMAIRTYVRTASRLGKAYLTRAMPWQNVRYVLDRSYPQLIPSLWTSLWTVVVSYPQLMHSLSTVCGQLSLSFRYRMTEPIGHLVRLSGDGKERKAKGPRPWEPIARLVRLSGSKASGDTLSPRNVSDGTKFLRQGGTGRQDRTSNQGKARQDRHYDWSMQCVPHTGTAGHRVT
jgi:hypothetical protein